MPRGGARKGKPGKSYSNRSDLTPTAATGQQYGQAKAQLEAQKAMPIAAQPTPAAAPAAPPMVAPGGLGALTRPTDRPDEPITAGAPMGPGPAEIPGLPRADIDEPSLRSLISKLPLLERLASNPQASVESRILFRKVYAEALKTGQL